MDDKRLDATVEVLQRYLQLNDHDAYIIARAAFAAAGQLAQAGGSWCLIKGKPEDSYPCLLWHDDWVDPDFNPTGVRKGFWGPHPDDPDQECWIVARWNPCHDVWETERAEPQPSHWKPMPAPPTEQPAQAGELRRPEVEDEQWDGPAEFEGHPVKVKVKGAWYVRDDQPAPKVERAGEGPDPDVREALSRISWVLWNADPDSIRIARDDPQMSADWRAIKAARTEALNRRDKFSAHKRKKK